MSHICYICDKQMQSPSLKAHFSSRKHQKVMKEAQSLANCWIKVTGSPSMHINEDLIRSIFQSHGKILKIIYQNETFYIRFLKANAVSFSLERKHISCKNSTNNMKINLWVKPIVIRAHQPLEINVFHVDPENNQMDDFRRILSHTIGSIQNRLQETSNQNFTFENIATEIVSNVLSLAHNEQSTKKVYSELNRMFSTWNVHLQKSLHISNLNIRMYVFGSVEMGLALSRYSDLDICLNVANSYLDLLHETTHLLWQNSDRFHDILSIKGARVPIVKAVHTETDIPLDISFKSRLGWFNTKLIKLYLEYDTRVKTLLTLVKIWFKKNDLNDNRAFTSYSIYWMSLFYLQQLSPPLIPSVHQLLQFYPSTLCLEWEVLDSEKMEGCNKVYPPSKNSMCLEELVLGFFRFYQDLDLRDSVMCPLLGKILPRRIFEPENMDQLPREMNRYYKYAQEFPRDTLRISSQVCIQDPYDLSHNICKAVSHATTSLLQHHLATVWLLRQRSPAHLLLHLLEDRNAERDERLQKFDAENENLRLQRLLAACEQRKKAREMKLQKDQNEKLASDEKREHDKEEVCGNNEKSSKDQEDDQKSDTSHPKKGAHGKSLPASAKRKSPPSEENTKKSPLKTRKSLVIHNSKRTSSTNRGIHESTNDSISPENVASSRNKENNSQSSNTRFVEPQCESPRLVPMHAEAHFSENQTFNNSSVNRLFEQASRNSAPLMLSTNQITSIDNICERLDKTNIQQIDPSNYNSSFKQQDGMSRVFESLVHNVQQGTDNHTFLGTPENFQPQQTPQNPTTNCDTESSNPLLQMFTNLASSGSPVSSPPRPSNPPPGLQPFSGIFSVFHPFSMNHAVPVSRVFAVNHVVPVISPFPASPSSVVSGSPLSQSSNSSSSVTETLKLLAFHSPQHKLSPGHLQNKDVSNIENQLLGSMNHVNNSRVNTENLFQKSADPRESKDQGRVTIPDSDSHLDIDSRLQSLKQLIGTRSHQTGIKPLKTLSAPGDSARVKFIDVSTLEMNLRTPQDTTEKSSKSQNGSTSEPNIIENPKDERVKNGTNKRNLMDHPKKTDHPFNSSITSKQPSSLKNCGDTVGNITSISVVSPTRSLSINKNFESKNTKSNTLFGSKVESNNTNTNQRMVNGTSKPHSSSIRQDPVNNSKEMIAQPQKSLPANNTNHKQLLSTYYIQPNIKDKKSCSQILILPGARVDLCLFYDTVNEVLVEYFEMVCRIEIHSIKYLNAKEFALKGKHKLDVCQKRNKLLKQAGFDPPRALNHSKFQVEILKSNFLLAHARQAIQQNCFFVSVHSRLVEKIGDNQVHVNFFNENSKSETNQYVTFLTYVKNAFDIINKEITARYLSH